mmetsp:Transcript_28041/g.48645  ORF Transcript_28041/g.48645 Transcript_28041/m.48645 type:complete len:84 (+) Transcript_28041:102-353(+)
MGLSHRGLPEEEEATVEEVSAVVVARAGRDKKGIQPGQEAQVQVGGAHGGLYEEKRRAWRASCRRAKQASLGRHVQGLVPPGV